MISLGVSNFAMNPQTLNLLALAVGPAVLIITYVYARDKYDHEPIGLLLVSFLLGGLSIFPAIILETLLPNLGLGMGNSIVSLLIYTTFVVGFSEEFSKFFFLRIYAFRKKAFNEPFDGIMYCLMIGMGFATFENLLYIFGQETYALSLQVAKLRAITAVPAHAAFAVLMGYYAGKAKFSATNRTSLLLKGLLVAIIFHSLYDFFLMQQSFEGLAIGAFVSLALAIYLSMKAMKISKSNSPFAFGPGQQAPEDD